VISAEIIDFLIQVQRAGGAPRVGALITGLFEELVEPTLWGPVFVIDPPIKGSPLTKQHRGDRRRVARFEPFAGGMKIGNAWSELNDPVRMIAGRPHTTVGFWRGTHLRRDRAPAIS
jgi:lysyl-tRNA synthetase class II